MTDSKGNPLAQYFLPRPSAAGKDGYDPTSSRASNLGPNNAGLVKAINDRRAADAKLDGVAGSSVPADALTASASGLDPDISPAYAYEQVDTSRRSPPPGGRDGRTTWSQSTSRDARSGFLGEPRVDVLELDLALDALAKAG